MFVLVWIVDFFWGCFGDLQEVLFHSFHVSFKKMVQRRDDYGFHCYSELCLFVYCLLSKKMLAIPDDLFLINHPFKEEMFRAKMSGAKEFRQDCRKFLDQFVEKIHKTVYCSSSISQGLYSFCPELLFEGDDVIVFDLFAKLVTG